MKLDELNNQQIGELVLVTEALLNKLRAFGITEYVQILGVEVNRQGASCVNRQGASCMAGRDVNED